MADYIVPIYKVHNLTENWELLGFATSTEEGNKVVKALTWREIEECTFRYEVGRAVEQLRVEDLEK